MKSSRVVNVAALLSLELLLMERLAEMAKSRRPCVADDPTPDTQRVNVQMGKDEYTRLMIHCVMLKKGPGEVLTELVAANLKEFRVQRNPSSRLVGSDRSESDAQARNSDAA